MKDCRDCIHYHNEPMQGGSVEICTARKGEFYGSYVIKNVYDSCPKHRTPMQEDNDSSKLKEKVKKLKKKNKDLRQQVSDLEKQISWAEELSKKLNDDYCLLEDKHIQVLKFALYFKRDIEEGLKGNYKKGENIIYDSLLNEFGKSFLNDLLQEVLNEKENE